MITITPTPEVPAGPQLHFLGGHFAVGNTRIPYATVHMTVSQVWNFLRTPNELIGWDDAEAEIEALYQRQLDYRRVKTKILPYLTEASDRPRFFNAITVALVPYAERKIQGFDARSFNPPPLDNSGTTFRLSVGPITLGFYAEMDPRKPHTYAIGEIRWNYDEVAAVAIDGQHRLAALKALHEIDPAREHDTRIAVILMIPSPALGFVAPGVNGGLLRLLRTVFIDLNKHAKPVKRARLILLDDADPQSIIVRAMIGDRLRKVESATPLDNNRLPLALVDWHRDDAKFDNGPYVTSVLMLDRIVELLLGVKSGSSSTSNVTKQIQAFRRFGYVPSDECEQRVAALKEAEAEWQDPFSFPAEDLDRIRDSVGGALAEVVARTLTVAQPYRALISAREEVRALEPGFSTWFEAFASRDGTPEAERRLAAVMTRIQSEPRPPHIDAWEELVSSSSSGLVALKEDALFFKVVFQGAYFAALRSLWDEPFVALHEDVSAQDAGTLTQLKRWADRLLTIVNGILMNQPRLFDLKFAFGDAQQNQTLLWLGSALSVTKDTVDFSLAAQDRIREWLVLIALVGDGALAWRATRGRLPQSWEDFVTAMTQVDEDFAGRIETSIDWIKHGNTANRGSMLRIVDAMTESSDEAYKKRKATEHFERRMVYLWGILRRLEQCVP